jgi:hypothetical protein
MQEQMPAGAESPIHAGSPAGASTASVGIDDPRALQILSTEHWSLLATRSLAYNETFTRAAMFLTFLGASLVALGLISAATGFTSQLALVAAVILATDLFLGLATLGRILDAGQEEMATIVGMNRIRHAYREMVPAIEPYFSTPFHDDGPSVLSAYGVEPASMRRNIVHGLTTAAAMVGVVDAVVAGALVAVIALGLGTSLEGGLLAGFLGFAVMFAVGFWIGFVHSFRATRRRVARFPAPATDE